ncbi:MAG: DNA-binding protein [Alphaproteobacteria bacterium]|nr:DNA-binding protein [Alphaproteobacteria bacterium]
MGKRLYRHRNLSYWWCYDLDEIANHCDVHVQTVRAWIKSEGLQTTDSNNPLLVYGLDLIAFLKKQNDKGKCRTAFEQFYCMSCKEACPALQTKVALEQKPNGLCAKAICRTCKSKMNKTFKLNDFQKLKRAFNVVDVSQLYDCEVPTLKTHIDGHSKDNEFESLQGDLV